MNKLFLKWILNYFWRDFTKWRKLLWIKSFSDKICQKNSFVILSILPFSIWYFSYLNCRNVFPQKSQPSNFNRLTKHFFVRYRMAITMGSHGDHTPRICVSVSSDAKTLAPLDINQWTRWDTAFSKKSSHLMLPSTFVLCYKFHYHLRL